MADNKYTADEIERERRKATGRAKDIDEERLALKRALRQILEGGTQQELEAKLTEMGKGPETAEGRAFIEQFLHVRGCRQR